MEFTVSHGKKKTILGGKVPVILPKDYPQEIALTNTTSCRPFKIVRPSSRVTQGPRPKR